MTGPQEPKVEAAKPKRAKAQASFHVFAQNPENEKGWEMLTDRPVTATKRKEAIKLATAALTAEDKDGTFWAVPAGQFQPVKRKVRQEEVEEFE